MQIMRHNRAWGYLVLILTSVVAVLLTPPASPSREHAMLNLETPTYLERRQGELIIRHRFYGEVTDELLDTFLGMDLGANVAVGWRYSVREGLELSVSHTRIQKEYSAGLSYAYVIPEALQAQLGLQLFSLKRAAEERKEGLFPQLALQSDRLWNQATPVANIGYDTHNGKAGVGFGLDLNIFNKLSLIGEYFPAIDNGAKEDCFAFGFRVRTYGHRFLFLLGNSREIGTRRMMRGTDTRDLYFGFNIHRLLPQ